MRGTGLAVFDSTIQRTNAWLKDLMLELNWSDRRDAYLALRAVLHAMRDHLPMERAVDLGDALPMLIRGLYFEGWKPAGKPLPSRTADDFLTKLAGLVHGDRSMPEMETVARAVFRMLDRKAVEGEIRDLRTVLPAACLDLWPEARRAA